MNRRQFLAGILATSGLMLSSVPLGPVKRWRRGPDVSVGGIIAGPQVTNLDDIDLSPVIESLDNLNRVVRVANLQIQEVSMVPAEMLINPACTFSATEARQRQAEWYDGVIHSLEVES